MESPKPVHVAVDFDNTLAHFEGGRDGIFELFHEQHVPVAVVESLYEETKKEGGFNIDRLIKKVTDRVGAIIDETRLKQEFAAWLHRSLTLYVDAQDFLLKIKKLNIPLSIISVGDPSFQEQKIKALGINPDSLHIVPRVGDKSHVLSELLRNTDSSIIYIDDKATELDAIKRQIDSDKIITVRIIRSDSPYKDERAQLEHTEVSNLNDIEI